LTPRVVVDAEVLNDVVRNLGHTPTCAFERAWRAHHHTPHGTPAPTTQCDCGRDRIVRALTPVSEGGEAVPWNATDELGKFVGDHIARSRIIRAAFADPRAVEAVAKKIGSFVQTRALLAAACEAVLK
jgi:hypothetical protein